MRLMTAQAAGGSAPSSSGGGAAGGGGGGGGAAPAAAPRAPVASGAPAGVFSGACVRRTALCVSHMCVRVTRQLRAPVECQRCRAPAYRPVRGNARGCTRRVAAVSHWAPLLLRAARGFRGEGACE